VAEGEIAILASGERMKKGKKERKRGEGKTENFRFFECKQEIESNALW